MLKDFKVFVAKNFKSIYQINYLNRIAAIPCKKFNVPKYSNEKCHRIKVTLCKSIVVQNAAMKIIIVQYVSVQKCLLVQKFLLVQEWPCVQKSRRKKKCPHSNVLPCKSVLSFWNDARAKESPWKVTPRAKATFRAKVTLLQKSRREKCPFLQKWPLVQNRGSCKSVVHTKVTRSHLWLYTVLYLSTICMERYKIKHLIWSSLKQSFI